MISDRSLLAVFAHPDDETFRTGGTLALLAKRGVRVQVLTATKGGAGSCGDPIVCSQEELPDVRKGELHCACKALGLAPPILLNYQDGNLSKANSEKIVSEILTVVSGLQPQIMITFGVDGISGHPDHIAIGRYALRAFHQSKIVNHIYSLAVPKSIAIELSMTQLKAIPDESITYTVDIAEVWQSKMAAIKCHRTQLSQSQILEEDQRKQQLFLGTEHFRLVSSNHYLDNAGVDLLKCLSI